MMAVQELLSPEALAWAGAAAVPAAGALFPIVVGLGSSVTHCAGMCGPIHFFLASRAGSGSVWTYHAGRVLGYALLGAAAGSLGGLADALSGASARGAAGWLLALIYGYFGLQLLGVLPRRLRLEIQAGRLFPSRWFGRLAAEGRAGSFLFPAGLLASLLPCPSTHAVILFGMGLGSPLLGAAAMAALGLSTLPMFALIPRSLPQGLPWARYYGSALGAVFLGLSAWRVYGAAFAGTPACH